MSDKILQEYKITCQGCNAVRHVPYYEFKQKTSEEKSKGFMADVLTNIGISVACLPLGCCTSLASMDGVAARNRTPEEQREKYFELQKVAVCGKCGSMAKKVEVITHNINELDE